MIKILYIWHDCFVVMTPAATIVFDYWLDAGGLKNDFPAFIDRIDPALPLVVVVSHSHKDHYNPSIFGWAKRFDNIHFVVSTDIWKRMRHIVSPTSVYTGPKVDAGRVTVLRRNESAEIAGVRVAAFPSTDVGNSYIVESAGRRIFHAGDLNCWAWRDDSTEQEIRKAEGDFRACLRDIAAYLSGRPIDYCFFPVDSASARAMRAAPLNSCEASMSATSSRCTSNSVMPPNAPDAAPMRPTHRFTPIRSVANIFR